MRDHLYGMPRGMLVSITLLPWLAGCSGERAAVADPSIPQAVARADDAVREGTFRQTLLMTGELQAVYGEQVQVPRLPSWETTIRWMVEDGTLVAEGDRLVELDTAEIASDLENKITARQTAANQLVRRQAELQGTTAEKEFDVERNRVAARKAEIEAQVPEDVQTRKVYEEKQLAYEQARVAYEKAVTDMRGHLDAAEAELEVLRIDIAKSERDVIVARQAIETMVLRAPQSGIAVVLENRREDRKFQIGDTVWVGAGILEIPDLSKMLVEARLSDVDDGKITPGMRAWCTLDAYPEGTIGGTVRAIAPIATAGERRSMQRFFTVELDLDESDPELMRPGMSVKVEVETTLRERAVLVSRRALEFDADGAYLRLAEVAHQRVRLGPCNAQDCVLEEGPPVGTQVGLR
ncbi:MAG TPA: efflux RND transporter periplasmic adaptor subunit [Acidobacteriota bacterium]|jgi:multidrug resistance efflux pump|nr:efflux RND transporter periplasmic adaptor subunit [Acidobacteriota bacterium]